ncbi:lysylphosphatidylglycerol synthase domain-containing protein [Streptomyces sp. NPDC088124]|uniref:lysylphosphatidylglycerol synthase domain-containing protein n=1 Tax=Streptomyces sp. NPDC088124 TaxID=3154654 RepID=UPI00341CC636
MTPAGGPAGKRAGHAVSLAVTLVAAGGICWWALRGVDGAALAQALGKADVPVAVLSALGYTAAFYALDVAGFTLVYRRHLAPDVPTREVATVVCGKQLLGLIFPPLTKVVAPLYFRRRWGVGAARTLGATEVLTVADGIVVLACIGAGATLGSGLPGGAALLSIGPAAGLAVFLLWVWLPAGRRIFPRLRDSAFLSVFVRTGPAEMAVQLALRAGLVLAMFAAWWLLISAMGLDLGLQHLAQFCAVFLFATQLPLSIGGYGGPQGVCVLLLADTWHVLSRTDAVALSLLWSTLYLLSRATVSAFFVLPMVRLLSGGNTPPDGPEKGARPWTGSAL